MPGVLLVLPLELLSLETVGKKTRDTVTWFFPLIFRGIPATVHESLIPRAEHRVYFTSILAILRVFR